jgi:hypothetical protein
MSEQRTNRIGEEREIPPPKDDPGMRATDDHVAGSEPDRAHQPTTRLDEGVGREHLSSASQGARPVAAPTAGPGPSPAGTDDFAGGGIATGSSDLLDDEAAGGGPSGDEDSGGGPAFEADDR